MSEVLSGHYLYVVTDSYVDGSQPKFIVHGVYSSAKLARIAAYHPHGRLQVLRIALDAEPVDEAEVLDT